MDILFVNSMEYTVCSMAISAAVVISVGINAYWSAKNGSGFWQLHYRIDK